MVDHEPMAHGSRSSGVACVVERWIIRCVSKERVGRNVLVRAAETFSAEPWREEWWKTAEWVTDALTHAKSASGKSSRCAIMTTNVDDCDLDAEKPLRTLVWNVVRTQFAAKDSVQMQKFLGVVREAWTVPPRVVVSDSLRVITKRRSWKTLWNSVLVRFVFAPLLDSPSHRLIPSYCLSSLEVCCSCHAARASTFPLSLHDLPDLSHADASGLERNSDTFSVLLHTLLKGLSS